jgi:NAD(P)-dependent dehydrogenase (short-subunit alcohol dehydrogenase family)
VWLALKHEIPALLASGGGAIVNNASIAGVIGFPGVPIYVASKHAVVGLTKALALEYGQSGIRINAVCPAAIDTEMFKRFTAGNDDLREQAKALHPLGRIGQPEEVAAAVIWLCSAHASFITGHALMVDGGFTTQ